jgi:hypothetical protein
MSPFGVDKDQGGDNPSNTKFVEDCKSSIKGNNKRTDKPFTESEKIAICKAQLKKSKAALDPRENLVFSSVDGEMMDVTNEFMSRCIQKMIDGGEAQTTEQAKMLCERALETNDNDVEAAINYLNRPKYNFR